MSHYTYLKTPVDVSPASIKEYKGKILTGLKEDLVTFISTHSSKITELKKIRIDKSTIKDEWWFKNDIRKTKKYLYGLHGLIRKGYKDKFSNEEILHHLFTKIDDVFYTIAPFDDCLIRLTEYNPIVIKSYAELVNFIDFFDRSKIRYLSSYDKMKEFFNIYPNGIIYFD